ncbi:MAG: hypothetical protein NXY57DRAFT_978505 [Lentinula lateritia]|uniref:Uncharacterized protein n=1 Tax=Lentinula lateritia TaxID=40482 RepID=A0ABQ8V1U3_9AGAR|nr:MAG: hypothetical protein NXY57DRAFT_978505 [Lentinula lateritia]KAJ4466785.1 hypothetical protein C8R41DRAFT_67125 [Lentinula lateritia]KAJ4474224.1 hypothetical protein C8R41DRAFT_923990 [Lentinula lateritia]
MGPGALMPLSTSKPSTHLSKSSSNPQTPQSNRKLKREFAEVNLPISISPGSKRPCPEPQREENGQSNKENEELEEATNSKSLPSLLATVDRLKAKIWQLELQIQAQEAAAKCQEQQISDEHSRYLQIKIKKVKLEGQLEELKQTDQKDESEAVSKLAEMREQIKQRDERAEKDAAKLKQYEELISSMEMEMIHMKKKSSMVHDLCRKAGTILQAPYTFANNISLKDIQDVIDYRPHSTKVNRNPFSDSTEECPTE